MKVICVCYIFCSSLIYIIIFHSPPDTVADGHCAGADGTAVAAVVTASSLVMLLSVREYKCGSSFDAGDCDSDDGGCNNGFDGDGTMAMATAVLAVWE
jgi:hypothetical protein